MHYKCYNHVFKTEEEANKFRNFLMAKTGYVCGVTSTLRKVTHIFDISKYTVKER